MHSSDLALTSIFIVRQSPGMNTQTKPGPILFYVSEFKVGSTPTTMDPVDRGLVDDLVHFFSNPRVADERAQRAEKEVTKLAMAKGTWLMCGCQNGTNNSAPVLYGQRIPRGLIRKAVLIPFYARGDHDANCPFSRSAPDNSSAPSLVERKKKIGGLAVLNALGEGKGQGLDRGLRDSEDRETASQTRFPTIARVLFTLLSGAEINQIDGKLNDRGNLPRRSVTVDKDLVKEYLEEKSLFGKDIAIAAVNLFALSFSALKSFQESLLRYEKESWGGFHPHGFIIDQVVDFRRENGRWILENPWGADVDLHGRLYLPGENTPGPWLAICLVTKLPGDTSPMVYRAYMHPIEDLDGWFLVDSDLERRTLDILRKSQWVMAKVGKPYAIIKPLLDVAPTEGDMRPVRPDFIVAQGSSRLVVETMGYQSEDYLARKTETHKRMKKLKDVRKLIEHVPPDDKGFISEFKSFVG